jgi:polyribonucleotide nucleotidyltransferase
MLTTYTVVPLRKPLCFTHSSSSTYFLSTTRVVPNGVVGFIIGRGGETITSMQARTGAKVQIQKEHELQPGQTMRIITLSAPTQEAVDQCRDIITSMVEDRVGTLGDLRRGSGSMGMMGGNNPAGAKPKEAEVQAALYQGAVTIQSSFYRELAHKEADETPLYYACYYCCCHCCARVASYS